MKICSSLLLLAAIVSLTSFNVVWCATVASPWIQNLSLPLTDKPTDLTSVYYSMPIIQIKTIDTVSSDFFTDCYFYISWRDDRYLTHAQNGDAYDDKTRWKADPEIMNSGDTKVDFSGTFTVSHGPPLFTDLPASTGGAWITGFTRMSRKFYAEYDLRQFPFDQQSAQILFESYSYNQDKLVWVPALKISEKMLQPSFRVEGWNIISKGSLTSPNVYESLGETYHRAGITLKLGRVPVYFLGKYVLNISLIVLMALATLVFDNGSENGFAVPVACFMGIVSWMFVLAAQIPVLGYNTRLDDFMAASYLTVFLVVLFSCYRIKRSRNPKPDDSSSSTVVPYTASDAKHNAGDAKVQVEQAKRSSPGRCSRCFSCCFHWIFHPILIHFIFCVGWAGLAFIIMYWGLPSF